MTEIAKVDLITAEQEVDLARRIRAGDQMALEKVLEEIFNHPKVVQALRSLILQSQEAIEHEDKNDVSPISISAH